MVEEREEEKGTVRGVAGVSYLKVKEAVAAEKLEKTGRGVKMTDKVTLTLSVRTSAAMGCYLTSLLLEFFLLCVQFTHNP